MTELEKQIEQDNKLIESLTDTLEVLESAEGPLDNFAVVLNLEDKDFEVVAPQILREFEKTMHDSNDVLGIVQVLNSKGIKLEEITDSYDDVMRSIDQLDNVYSKQKLDFIKTILGTLIAAITENNGIAKRIIPIPIEKCHADAKVPVYAHSGDAGLDVYTVEDVTIHPGQTVIVPTGLKCALPLGYELQVRPRSGLSVKTPLRVANAPGTIDSNYRGEIGIIVTNTTPAIKDIQQHPIIDEHGKIQYFAVDAILYGEDYTIPKGTRIAQLVLSEVPSVSFYEVDSVMEVPSERGEKGFGSSGVK